MEKRKFNMSLKSSSGTSYKIDNADLSLSYMDGFPTLTVSLVDIDQISDLNDAASSGNLIQNITPREFSFSGQLEEFGTGIKLDKLCISRISAQEDRDGYNASLFLIPVAAAMASIRPGIYNNLAFNKSVSDHMEAIINKFNAESTTTRLTLLWELSNDPICCMFPRFVSMPYLDMLKKIGEFHGFHVFIDFSGRVRAFSPMKASSTTVYLGKHQIQKSDLVYDALQTLV